MRLKLDLHVHTEKSYDGRMSLDEAVRLAKERGLNGIAVCDHDEVMDAAAQYGDFIVIPGTEVSCREGHLLGLFVREKISARTVEEAAAQIHAQGGIAVMAHPFEHAKDGMQRFAQLSALSGSLDGFEVVNSRADRKIRNANRLAMEFCHTDASTGHVYNAGEIKMILPPAAHISGSVEAATAGSDAHLPEEVGNAWVEFDVDGVSSLKELGEEALKAAVLSSDGDRSVHGIRSRAVCTARSGFTARKRRGCSLAGWLKWLAFYVKCALEDLRYAKDRRIC